MTDALNKIRQKLQKARVSDDEEGLSQLTPSQRQAKIIRLNKLLSRLNQGRDITRRDLKNVLTSSQWDRFEQSNTSLSFDEDRPSELDSYLGLLKKADFYYSRAGITKTTKRSHIDHLGRTGSKRLYDKADKYYELAIERLNEIFETADFQVQQLILSHLDRPWHLGDAPNLGPNDMPRIRKSRSRHSESQSEKTKYEIKRQNKSDAINDAIASLNAK